MFVLFIVAGTIGWLLGVWLPWWGIGGVLLLFVVQAYRGEFDGSLANAISGLAIMWLSVVMVIVGFAFSDVTWAMIFGFTKTVFMGG